MTARRQRFIDGLQLQGMSARTQQASVRAVRQFAEHDRKSPEVITEEELRQYCRSVKNINKWSRATITLALCGIKFFDEQTLPREWTTLDVIRPPHESRLPVILTVEEVQRLLHPVRLLRYRACLTTIYAWGLRLTEGTHLQVADIDSGRMLGHVRLGKGGNDRDGPLPQRTRELLRESGKPHRTPVWLFPATGRGGIGAATATEPLPNSSVQMAFRAALKETGIVKDAHVHTLRHS
jgi:integrase/recombinase XerD